MTAFCARFLLCYLLSSLSSCAAWLRSMRGSSSSYVPAGMMDTKASVTQIEEKLRRTFQALPKNRFGRLGQRGQRQLVHRHFLKERGWVITGLEQHGHNANFSSVHEANLVKDKAPSLVASLLEAHQSQKGLTLRDMAETIVVLEQLIIDEAKGHLAASYRQNDKSVGDALDRVSLREVLMSYSMGLYDPQTRNWSRESDARVKQRTDLFPVAASRDIAVDTVGNFQYEHRARSNPFVEPQYLFNDVLQMAEDLVYSHASFQESDCHDMKRVLYSLDAKGNGRVPLSIFYAQHNNNGTFRLAETIEYLRASGSLDESIPGAPQVIAVNYILGSSNCIAPSSYYSLCCMNECEGILTEIEETIQGPTAPPELLLKVVRGLSYMPRDAPQLAKVLAERLYLIAEQHGGEVPLHGRLFAQWLHYLYPTACPYPSIVEETEALTISHGLSKSILLNTTAQASVQERAARSEAGIDLDSSDEAWSDDEVLLVQDDQLGGNAVRVCALMAMSWVLYRLVHDAFTSLHSVWLKMDWDH